MALTTETRRVERFCRFVAVAASLIVVLANAAASADERWAKLQNTVFTHVAQGGELPNAASPLVMAEDGEGFLWVGTENGLARWDGYRFRTYKSDPTVPGNLPDNVVIALHTDVGGRLWIGTDSAGLARYDPERDRFVRYRLGPRGALDLAVYSIADDGRGGIWAGTRAGLYHLDSDGHPLNRPHDDESDRSLPDSRVEAVLRDRRGTLWVGTPSGVARRRIGALRFGVVKLPGSDGGADASQLLEDDAGRVWIATRNHGAYVVDPGSDLVRRVPHLGTIAAMTQAGPGEIWLGSNNDGVVAVNASTLQARPIRHDPSDPTTLPNDNILTLYRDRSGLVWAGTPRSLSHCDPRQTYIAHIGGDSSAADVRNVLSAPDGRVWVALGATGVELLDLSSVRTTRLQLPAAQRGAKDASDIEVLTTTPGGVYLGGYRGLYRTDWTGKSVIRIALSRAAERRGIRSMLFDAGVLWIGGSDGLWTLDRRDRVARILSPRLGLRFTDERVTAMESGAGGTLWIGTENGLNWFDPRSYRVERILPNPADPAALSAGMITALLTDSRGRIWIGAQGGGINVLSRDRRGKPRFRRLGLAQGLPNDDINKLIADRRGNIWASTDNGLAIIDPATMAIRSLQAAEGLGIAGYWNNSGAATASGELLFGGLGGLTIVRPDLLQRWTYQPPVVVTELSIAGKTMFGNRSRSDGSPAAPSQIGPDGNSLTVEFSAQDYSAPERNHYAYRLEGFDSRWIDANPSRRFAAYTNLSPGNYRLLVRGSNRAGVWNEKALVLAIGVLPAWYQTTAFRIAVVFAALGFVALLVRGWTELLRRRQRELERDVAARTAELHATQQKLVQLAYFYTLTGLPNRRMFAEQFQQLLFSAKRDNKRVGVVLIDLDGFKRINDTLGHDAGDAVLVEAASRLRAAVRDSDCVARLGGDEFAILLNDVGEMAEAECVCLRIVESFAVSRSDAMPTATASVGVALFPGDGDTQETLYKSADLALYDAKRAGRNTWRSYHAELRV